LETLLSGALSVVHNDGAALGAILGALTASPADLLGLPCGKIKPGTPADLILIDIEQPWVCDAGQLLSKSKNTPYDGRRMQGTTKATLVQGDVVFDPDKMFG
jgi:dihydroorotase